METQLITQVRISPTNNSSYGTAGKLKDGDYITMAHVLAKNLGWDNSNTSTLMDSLKPLIQNGSIELVSKYFQVNNMVNENAADVVIKLKPKFFKDNPKVSLAPLTTKSFNQPKEFPNLTKAAFFRMNLFGANFQQTYNRCKR